MRSIGSRRATAAAAMAICMAFVPGSAQANHVQCGDTVTRDTTLDSDLVDCPVDGVLIGAPGVTLDLNGHTIDGAGSGANAGVSNRTGLFPHSGAIVRGGTVQEFNYGIRLGGDDGKVEGIVALHNFDGGIVVSGSRHVLRHNTAAANSSGIWLAAATDSAVADNVAEGNAIGIDVHEANRNTVVRNVLRDNDNAGLQAGIRVYASWGNLIERNRLAGGRIGILVQSPLDEESPPGDRVIRNRVTGAAEDGIQLTGTGGQVRLVANEAVSNGDDGIHVGEIPLPVTERSVVLERNRADHNADLGIEAVPGVTDGGGNRARGNGNPLQCLVVVCRTPGRP